MDMSAVELLTSIEQYKTQLEQVTIALECGDGQDKSELQELRLNIIEVLELTLSQLDRLEEASNSSKNIRSSPSACKNLEDELALFKREIATLDSTPSDSPEEENGLIEQLLELEGKEVRAPYVEKWGGYSYHTAVILKIITSNSDDSDAKPFTPKALVLYSYPTDIEMQPCKFFLDGRCKFENDTCKFSHGKEVEITDLRDYIPPDRSTIDEGSKVLALHDSNDIWHRGVVEDVLQNREGFSLNCEVCRKVVEVNLERMIPVNAEEPTNCEDNISDTEDFCDESISATPVNCWLENKLTCKLGDWEKHTKGIGSKLMGMMGYIVGTGLGRNGDGCIDPVPMYAYPQGISLDRCMELRQNSDGGNDFIQVEKRMLKQQKQFEKKQKQRENELSMKTSVFDIINNKLAGETDRASTSQNSEPLKQLNLSKESLLGDSNKELNLKNFQLGSRISQLKMEISKLEMSQERHRSDHTTLKSLEGTLSAKKKELASLCKAETSIENEQKKRKFISNLTKF